ncbi:hypothetical protein [Natranaerobius thermophilus]|uniref:Uncharacterized protein n=1 Tax=Natranaerobius thermophilus (strain ATCC BAA-1301 / DSM 18059 / JW/NM-WN-LF) TaxID=457570 RepID=B2A5D9_NATTJ|nr:hypothetical protein [Natranaerobius thermophilus]ACB83973.1 hypothetical protein Nther_0377 [Natranaerobius thermophilus JW/NM-WN-LF]
MAEKRVCPFCGNSNYSADTGEIWICTHCKKEFHKKESQATRRGACG